eukprot:GHVT01047540.1.p1 GENE.GHVT01047540.1~~GHVT01047540.1.p1  ORF type:complete len:334 (-),score=71.10 GHVT01047540.1:872-1873(-)
MFNMGRFEMIRNPFAKFNAAVCAANLQMAVARAKMNRNKLLNARYGLEIDIANLIRDGKDQRAYVRAEQLLRSERSEAALDLLQTICEAVHSHMAHIQHARTCPPDVMPSIHSIIFAENRIGIPELKKVAKQMQLKFGSEWVNEAAENKLNLVNSNLVELLSLLPAEEALVSAKLQQVVRMFQVPRTRPAAAATLEKLPKPSAPFHSSSDSWPARSPTASLQAHAPPATEISKTKNEPPSDCSPPSLCGADRRAPFLSSRFPSLPPPPLPATPGIADASAASRSPHCAPPTTNLPQLQVVGGTVPTALQPDHDDSHHSLDDLQIRIQKLRLSS